MASFSAPYSFDSSPGAPTTKPLTTRLRLNPAKLRTNCSSLLVPQFCKSPCNDSRPPATTRIQPQRCVRCQEQTLSALCRLLLPSCRLRQNCGDLYPILSSYSPRNRSNLCLSTHAHSPHSPYCITTRCLKRSTTMRGGALYRLESPASYLFLAAETDRLKTLQSPLKGNRCLSILKSGF